MKKYSFIFILILLPGFFCGYGAVSMHFDISRFASHRSLKEGSKFTLLIDNPFYLDIEGNHNLFLKVNLLLVNHTNDTAKYLGTQCLFTKLYHTNNKNMIMVNDACEKGTSILLTIPPHKAAYTQLTFKFIKMPDTTFKFKIGMNLIKWTAGKHYDRINIQVHFQILYGQTLKNSEQIESTK